MDTHTATLLATADALTLFGWALAFLPLVVLAFAAWYRSLGNITQRSEWTEGLTFSTAGAETAFFGPLRRFKGRFVSALMADFCRVCKGTVWDGGNPCEACDVDGSFTVQGEMQDRKAAESAPEDLVERNVSEYAYRETLAVNARRWDTSFRGAFPLRAVAVGIGMLDLRPAPFARLTADDAIRDLRDTIPN